MLSVVPLESLDGVSYVASHDATIGAVGATQWTMDRVSIESK
jgi:hypothetical protein